jgi:hypothetical protein
MPIGEHVSPGHRTASLLPAPSTMDDKLKEQLLPAVIVFCWSVLGWVLYQFFSSPVPLSWGQFGMHAAIGAGIGIVLGGITAGVMMMRK